jgi:hypothetical protein
LAAGAVLRERTLEDAPAVAALFEAITTALTGNALPSLSLSNIT